MKKYIILISVLVIFLSTLLSYSDWREDLVSLIATNSELEKDELINSIIKEEPGWRELMDEIKDTQYPETTEKGMFVEKTTLCIDDVRRPWILHIPQNYDPQEPTPLLVILHGGVNRAEIIEDPVTYAEEHPLGDICEEEGWFALFPMGQNEATWWDEVGMANISNLIQTVKRDYNIDDDRVWMGGFSDGASASFLFSMVYPSDYGAILALNGHMGVGNLGGDLPTYATNFYNTPIFTTTTFDDGLYASDLMRPSIEMGFKAGGEILYKEMEGGHDFESIMGELSTMRDFLKSNPRNPFPTRIRWETADKEYGLCRWFSIEKVTTSQPMPWHNDFNIAMVDKRKTFGFIPGESEGLSGLLVDNVLEETPAEEMGLFEGDLIIKAGGFKVEDSDDLNEYKSTIERGDEFSLVVMRDGEEMTLYGQLPEPENYLLFKREQPSGLAIVTCFGNVVDVKTSRVGGIRVLVSPEMINPDEALIIKVNGVEVYNQIVLPDIEFMLRHFIRNRDKRTLYLAEIVLELSGDISTNAGSHHH